MSNIWIVGAGTMAREYAKILKSLGKDFICIGRGEKTAKEFSLLTGVTAFQGGLDVFLSHNPELPEAAIVATNLGSLSDNTISLLRYGVRRILCEKPGFRYPEELEKVKKAQVTFGGEVFYAYNRRFYASTLAAEKLIEEDGGLLSLSFEFTEWAHVVGASGKPQEDLNNWFYANSTHVVDLAFYLGGEPVKMSCFSKDENAWHNPVNFAGAGLTAKGALFNYQANWEAPGRWAVELLTKKHRIYLKPMEQLQIQDKGSVKVYPVEIDNCLDVEFKPGLYLETESFLEGNFERLCSLETQISHVTDIYKRINND